MDNLRGALLMTLAMAGFAIEDMFIKLMAGAMATWQIIGILALGGSVVFAVLTLLRGEALFSRAYLSMPILVRITGEMIGTMGFVTALALTPLSTASAILQATPLAVTLGATVFFGDPVGWRRWTAIIVGFFGVLLVIRPGLDGFDANSLFALLGVVGLGARDLATRRVPPTTSSMQLSFLAFLSLIPASLLLAIVSDRALVIPDTQLWLLSGATVVFGVLAYYAITGAMRVGEVSFVTPFRYSRILFALVLGVLVFGERPDTLVLIGSAIIVTSGIYTLLRERKLRRQVG